MKYRDFLEKWGLCELNLKAGFLEATFSPKDPDRAAAWDLYVELLTRITIQRLDPEQGNEKSALESIYALFPLTREILHRHGSGCAEFAKIAIPILNQKIRPFTTKWHGHLQGGYLNNESGREEFRQELALLQTLLRGYTRALSSMANVEDLTELESTRS